MRPDYNESEITDIFSIKRKTTIQALPPKGEEASENILKEYSR